jgi:hypothetical protein
MLLWVCPHRTSWKHGWILGEVRIFPKIVLHLPWEFLHLPWKVMHALPLGKVSMIDHSENLTFFGCLGSIHFVRKFFCKIETVIAIHLWVILRKFQHKLRLHLNNASFNIPVLYTDQHVFFLLQIAVRLPWLSCRTSSMPWPSPRDHYMDKTRDITVNYCLKRWFSLLGDTRRFLLRVRRWPL